RMRIEPGQHARDGGLDQLAVADRLDRVLADALERLAEQVQLIVNPALAALCLRQRRRRRQKRDQSRGHEPFTHKNRSPEGARTLSEPAAIAIPGAGQSMASTHPVPLM